MLESQFRLVVDQAPGHHQVAGNPLSAVSFESLDLVLGGAVQLLARDIVVDLRRPLTVRAVGAAQVTGIGNPHGTVLGTVAAKLAWAAVAAVEAAGCPVLAVSERLTVVPVTKAAAFAITLTAGTITIRLVLPVTVRFAVTVAERLTVSASERLTVTVAKGLTVSSAEAAALTVAFTARTITIRLVLPVTERLTVAVAERLTLTTSERLTLTTSERLTLTRAEAAAVAFTFAARTIAIGLAFTGTEAAAVAFTFAARTIAIGLVVAVTVRLTVTVAKGLTVPGARGATGAFATLPIFARTEPPGISA
jgi:hypothetical protein